MKKLYFSLLVCVFPLLTFSQHFEWAASMGRAQTETLSSVMDNNGNLTLLVSWETGDFPYAYYEEMHHIFDAMGDTIQLESTEPSLLVLLQFNKQGKLNWQKIIKPNGRNVPEEAFLSINNNGKISLIVNSGRLYVDDVSFYSLLEEDFIRNKEDKPAKNKTDKGEEDEEEEYDEYDGYNSAERLFFNEWHGLLQMDFSSKGELKGLSRILPDGLRHMQSVESDKKGGHILTGYIQDRDTKLGKFTLNGGPGGSGVIVRTDSMGTILWVQAIKSMSKSCCTLFTPQVSVAPNGTIYAMGRMENGIEFPGGKKEDFVTKADTTPYNRPFNSYVVAFSPDGKMLWYKLSGGKSFINSILANDKAIYISGTVGSSANIFGIKADTTVAKRGYIAAINPKDGKVLWLQTNTGNGFVTLTTDNSGNIYGLASYNAQSNGYPADKPAYFHTDTLPRRWGMMLVASYDAKGQYRWVKSTTSILFERSHYYRLFADGCNNLYLAGSAFAGLSIPMQYVDGAFLKGQAYGSMAYCTKIKNNINQIENDSNSVKASENPLFTIREVEGQAIEGQQGCTVSPGPWVMTVMPNPFSGTAKIRIITTYDDKSVNLDVYDMKGQKLLSLFSGKDLDKGEHWQDFDALASNLSSGTYLVVLRGSATVLSERVIYK